LAAGSGRCGRRGKTIELAEELGVADREQVEVSVRVASTKQSWGEGLRRCAGARAQEWTEEDRAKNRSSN